ncbi:MAG: hypothetical protein JJ964_15545 [Rhizobiales bacterium]|nr:hypothetical protein [Hyphomicrobiales bacterium]
MYKTKDDFKKEIEEAKKILESSGRQLERNNAAISEGGIQCDFELPYSSMPKIKAGKWLQNIKIA